jgi:hypothetical protein
LDTPSYTVRVHTIPKRIYGTNRTKREAKDYLKKKIITTLSQIIKIHELAEMRTGNRKLKINFTGIQKGEGHDTRGNSEEDDYNYMT